MKIDEWFLPKYTSNGATCVETLFTQDTVSVRNNLHNDAGRPVFSREEWEVFVAGLKDRDYDL